jgi:hypothetical protein
MASAINTIIRTETLDPGGALEVVLPAVKFYIELDRLSTALKE